MAKLSGSREPRDSASASGSDSDGASGNGRRRVKNLPSPLSMEASGRVLTPAPQTTRRSTEIVGPTWRASEACAAPDQTDVPAPSLLPPDLLQQLLADIGGATRSGFSEHSFTP